MARAPTCTRLGRACDRRRTRPRSDRRSASASRRGRACARPGTRPRRSRRPSPPPCPARARSRTARGTGPAAPDRAPGSPRRRAPAAPPTGSNRTLPPWRRPISTASSIVPPRTSLYLIERPGDAHAARRHHDPRRAPARIAPSLPREVPERIAHERARDRIGPPVLAAPGARGVGERGDAVEPLHAVLLGVRRHRRPHDGGMARGERVPRIVLRARTEIADAAAAVGPRASHDVLEPGGEDERRAARLDRRDAGIGKILARLIEGEERRDAERGDGQRVAALHAGLEPARVLVPLGEA